LQGINEERAKKFRQSSQMPLKTAPVAQINNCAAHCAHQVGRKAVRNDAIMVVILSALVLVAAPCTAAKQIPEQ
jgi:hypothetical protein